TQLCVVTLDPVEQTVDETVSVECWPQEEIAERQDGEDDHPESPSLPEEPPLPIVGDEIDLGACAAEALATAINPSPRKQGVAFDGLDARHDAEGPASGPFAKLAKLKPKS